MSDINLEYKELKEKSNKLVSSIKERQEQIKEYFLNFIQLKNYSYFQEILVRNDSNFISIEFSKKEGGIGREVTLYLSIPREFLYSVSSELNENNFSVETEINYCSTIISGSKNVSSQADFFIQTYSIINELNKIISDQNSGLFIALKEYYFLNNKLNESLYEIHSQMRQLKKLKKEQLTQKILDTLVYRKPEQQDILNLLNNGSKITLIQPSININEDSLFLDEPQYQVDLVKGQVYKVDRTYYFEGQEFVKRFNSKLNKSQFLDMLSKVVVE